MGTWAHPEQLTDVFSQQWGPTPPVRAIVVCQGLRDPQDTGLAGLNRKVPGKPAQAIPLTGAALVPRG